MVLAFYLFPALHRSSKALSHIRYGLSFAKWPPFTSLSYPDVQIKTPKYPRLCRKNGTQLVSQKLSPQRAIRQGHHLLTVLDTQVWPRLLGQVFKSLEEQDIDSRSVELDRLDHAFQTSLALTMRQSQGAMGAILPGERHHDQVSSHSSFFQDLITNYEAPQSPLYHT